MKAEWTKTPPTEPGYYLFLPNDGDDIFLQRILIKDFHVCVSLGKDFGTLSINDFESRGRWCSVPIEYPEVPFPN